MSTATTHNQQSLCDVQQSPKTAVRHYGANIRVNVKPKNYTRQASAGLTPATGSACRASHSLAAVVGEGVDTGLDTVVGDATGEGLSVGLPT